MVRDAGDRLRILVAIKGLGIGGAEQLIADGAHHWDRARFDYRVAYVLPWKDQLVPTLEGAGVAVDCIGSGRRMGPGVARNLRRLVRDWRPDLVHAHLPSVGVLARTVTGVPVVYTEHNVPSSYRQPTRTLNRLTFGRNAAVIAVSDAVAEGLRGFPGPQPRVIPNGVGFEVDAAEATVARAGLGLPEGSRLVVHVGNIRPHKGHENLIAAVGLLTSPDVVVASIGGEKHAGDLDRVRAAARAAGVADHLRFLGMRTDARALLAAADVVVNPSDVEGLPLAVLEALSLAKPVVATAVGGVPSVVVDGVSGRLVPPGDPVALAAALEEALASGATSGWGEAGAALVAEHHGIDQMIEGYEATYDEVLGVSR